MNDRSEIKRKRIKEHFLTTTKVMIASEGYENVSIRKIAEETGYSYATIYNYFRDLNELFWETKQLMIKDIYDTLMQKSEPASNDLAGIKKGFRSYAHYYFENPNIFKFLYFKTVRPSDRQNATIYEEPDFSRMWEYTFRGLIAEGKVKEQETEVLAKTLIYSVHGLITLCLSNSGSLTEETAYQEIDDILDYLLRG